MAIVLMSFAFQISPLEQQVIINTQRLNDLERRINNMDTPLSTRVELLESHFDTAVETLQILIPIVLLQLVPMGWQIAQWIGKMKAESQRRYQEEERRRNEYDHDRRHRSDDNFDQ